MSNVSSNSVREYRDSNDVLYRLEVLVGGSYLSYDLGKRTDIRAENLKTLEDFEGIEAYQSYLNERGYNKLGTVKTINL